MSVMTPIKALRVVGLSVFSVDWANHADLKATAPDHDNAMWLGSSLAQYHRVPLETADHGLETPEVVWTPAEDPETFRTFHIERDQMPIDVVPSSRADIIQEAADRLNDWLAKWPAGNVAAESTIAQLRSYAAE